jgi:anti-sigma B factor antagonist
MLSKADNAETSTQTRVPFAVSRRELDQDTSVVVVQGELDLSTAPQLKWLLVDAVEAGATRLVLDLAQTTFMDSTALGVLVGVNRSLGAPGGLTIVCDKPSLLRIFELSGMDRAFAICPTLEEALASASVRAEAG